MPRTKRWGVVFYGVELYEVYVHECDARGYANERNKKSGTKSWSARPVTVTWAEPKKGKGK